MCQAYGGYPENSRVKARRKAIKKCDDTKVLSEQKRESRAGVSLSMYWTESVLLVAEKGAKMLYLNDQCVFGLLRRWMCGKQASERTGRVCHWSSIFLFFGGIF